MLTCANCKKTVFKERTNGTCCYCGKNMEKRAEKPSFFAKLFGAKTAEATVAVADPENEFKIKGSLLIRYIGKGGDVAIPDTVTEIEAGAFENTNAENIFVPDSVEIINDYAFKNCTSLHSIELGEGLETIGFGALEGCEKLRSITLPFVGEDRSEQATKRFCYLFGVEEGYTPEEEIPEGLEVTLTSAQELAEEAFAYTPIRKIFLPATLEKIGKEAFTCSDLTEFCVDEANENYRAIDGHLYTKDGKTLIQYALRNSAKEFSVPDGVETIEADAFSCTEYLEKVFIPESVTSIGKDAFQLLLQEYNHRKLSIYCAAKSKPSGWHDAWNSSKLPVEWEREEEDM